MTSIANNTLRGKNIATQVKESILHAEEKEEIVKVNKINKVVLSINDQVFVKKSTRVSPSVRVSPFKQASFRESKNISSEKMHSVRV